MDNKQTYRVFYHQNLRAVNRGTPKSVDMSDYEAVANVPATCVEEVFGLMNVVEGDELPVRLRVRSMCVGDLVRDCEGRFHYCASAGFAPVEVTND